MFNKNESITDQLNRMRIALVKSKPRTPNTRDYAAHTDYTPTAHGYVDMCDMSCI